VCHRYPTLRRHQTRGEVHPAVGVQQIAYPLLQDEVPADEAGAMPMVVDEIWRPPVVGETVECREAPLALKQEAGEQP
jgi:hypothetical protein